MPTLKIWESVRCSDREVLQLDERVNYKAVTFTGTAGVSTAFGDTTSVISIKADANCAIRVSKAGTLAIVDDFPLLATDPRLDLRVQPGQRISAIAT